MGMISQTWDFPGSIGIPSNALFGAAPCLRSGNACLLERRLLPSLIELMHRLPRLTPLLKRVDPLYRRMPTGSV